MANIKSAISFGLVNIPVLYTPIIHNNDMTFHQLHKKCGHRIQYQKYCNHCKKQVKEIDLVKGYEVEDGNFITFTKEELANMRIDLKGTIEVVAFVPEKEIPSFYYEKSYVLTPPKKEKAYSLFLEVLKKSGKVAVAKTTLGTKFYYCLLRFYEGTILMSTMYFEEEIEIPDTVSTASFSKQEFDLALKLVEQLESHFTPSEYQDDYQNQIKDAIQKKQEGKSIRKKKSTKSPTGKDLITSLQKSLEAN